MKNTFINASLKGLITGATFALGLLGIVYASNWISTTYNSGGETLTADEGAQLTLSKWNALVGRVSGITTQSNGKVALTETSPAISDNNAEIPSTAAVKTYVDAQVQASSGGESWQTLVKTCGCLQWGGSCVCEPPTCPSGWTDLGKNGMYSVGYYADSYTMFVNQDYRTCTRKQ